MNTRKELLNILRIHRLDFAKSHTENAYATELINLLGRKKAVVKFGGKCQKQVLKSRECLAGTHPWNPCKQAQLHTQTKSTPTGANTAVKQVNLAAQTKPWADKLLVSTKLQMPLDIPAAKPSHVTPILIDNLTRECNEQKIKFHRGTLHPEECQCSPFPNFCLIYDLNLQQKVGDVFGNCTDFPKCQQQLAVQKSQQNVGIRKR